MTATRLRSERLLYGLCILGALSITVIVILGTALLFTEHSAPAEYYATVRSYIKLITPASRDRPTCPAMCPSDPFVQPGMIHWSPTGSINETRWIPFPQAHTDWEPREGYKFSQVPRQDVVPPQAYEASAVQYTAALNRGEDFEWMKGRMILFIDDRNNVDQLCELVGGQSQSWGGHTGGYCYLERLDLLIMNWFLYGMIDDDDYPSVEERPFKFEERFQQVMIPHMEKTPFAQRTPGLVVIGSLFWDEAFITKTSHLAGRERGEAPGFLWSEIAWHRSRVRSLIQHVRYIYGEDIPLMYRVRQIRQNAEHWGLLKIFQLDMGCRAMAKEMGVKLFTWAGKLEGFNKYYDNDQHFGLGPNSYIFGDMTFFYLWRALLPGCWQCHQWDD